MKYIRIIISCLLLAALTVGCGAKERKATLYLVSGDTQVTREAVLKDLEPQTVLDALMKAAGAPSVTVRSLDKHDGTMALDLSLDFLNYVNEKPTFFEQYNFVQSVANTALKNFGDACETVTVSVEGCALITTSAGGQGDLSYPMSFYVPDAADKPIADATPVPTATPTPTPTPTPEPTAEPTPTPTSSPTPTPKKETPKVTKRPSTGKKTVAFTFDDGPSGTYTKKIVDKLKEHNGKATFFVVGNLIKGGAAEGMKYAYDNGCEIAIHGYTHTANYKTCSDSTYREELSKTADAIEKAIGARPTLMRPIGGSISNERVKACEYPVILWSIDSEDWKHKKDGGINTIVNNVLKGYNGNRGVQDGDIILMHEIYANSYTAFCRLIDELAAQDYEFVTVTELLAGDLQSGRKYTRR